MSDDKNAPEPSKLPSVVLTGILVFGFLILARVGFGFLFGRPELLTTFTTGPYTINVYAEPEFTYESPGYIYFELQRWGRTRIPQRRFMAIGSERKPRQDFALIMTADEETVALVLNNEVQMIHEFSSGYTWPGPYTNVTEAQWQIAEMLLQRLRATNPEILCSRQERYGKELDRLDNDS